MVQSGPKSQHWFSWHQVLLLAVGLVQDAPDNSFKPTPIRVPASESEQIVQATRERGRPVWYIEALNEGHGYSFKEHIDVYEQATILFLQRYLVNP
jgi:hypothetical protein